MRYGTQYGIVEIDFMCSIVLFGIHGYLLLLGRHSHSMIVEDNVTSTHRPTKECTRTPQCCSTSTILPITLIQKSMEDLGGLFGTNNSDDEG